MKLYIVADMEGIAGVVADVQTGGASAYFEAARLQYTREIRSVCEAALSAGAEEVYVNDFHGNGLTLITDQLPREVMVIRGGFRPTSGYDLLDSTFTGLVLLGIHARTGLVTFYGPALVASFGELSPLVDETLAGFRQICQAGGAAVPHTVPTPAQWTEERLDWENQTRAKQCQPNRLISVGTGRVRGRLIGGNLNTMAGIWGSPYMPAIEQGDILLLEDSLHLATTVERSFAHLKLCGVFDRIGALVLGKHELFDSQGSGRRPLDILLEVVGEPTFPILAELDCAHTHPMLTLPLGIEVALDLDRQQLTPLEPWWRAE